MLKTTHLQNRTILFRAMNRSLDKIPNRAILHGDIAGGSTLDGVLLRVRLLKAHWGTQPFELHDDLLDRAIEGLEAMAAAGG